jgi:enoyl-[acyl-carrier protein] reductase II
LIQEVKSAEGIILEMIADYNAARQEIVAIDFNYRNDQN